MDAWSMLAKNSTEKALILDVSFYEGNSTSGTGIQEREGKAAPKGICAWGGI